MGQDLARRVAVPVGARGAMALQKRPQKLRRQFGELKARVVLQGADHGRGYRLHGAFGGSFMRLIGAQTAVQVVQQVAQDESVQRVQAEIDSERHAALPRTGTQAVVLLKGQHAESVVSGGSEPGAEFGLIGAKAAGPSGACGEEGIVAHNLLAGLRALQPAQILDQVANREISRVAQAATAILLADLVGKAAAWLRDRRPS